MLRQPKSAQPAPAPVLASQEIQASSQISDWRFRHPMLSIWLVSILAVVVNCFPIIFCGRSYVSPATSSALVYPTPAASSPLPGNPVPQIWQHGSDSFAEMLWGVPVGFIQSRSIWQHGELPLWNRYSHAGDTLVGQGISMLGDPLQWIVIFGHGSALAWDVKFLAAKLIFCLGFGWLIFRVLGSHGLSLLYAVLAAYCGAFFYIDNHLVFFVFAYAPWILLSALACLELRATRRYWWALTWLLANVACFNAGHVETAVILIGGLNLAALATVAITCRSWVDLLKTVGRLAVVTLLFLALTAPGWVSFLVSLAGAYTTHSGIKVAQLPLVNLPGLFDDMFNQLLLDVEFDFAPAPGTSLLVLSGCLFSIMHWRELCREPFFWVNSAAIGLELGLVFKIIPASVIAVVPLLNRVGHTYTDFSFLLVIHLTLQSAYGFMALARLNNLRRVAVDVFWIGVVMGVMMLGYHWGTPIRGIPWNYFTCAAAGALGAPLLFGYLKNRPGGVRLVGWLGIVVLGFLPTFRFGLYPFGNETLLMVPGPRVQLDGTSPAVEKIQAENTDPFRVTGFGSVFFGDYSAVYGLESISSCAPLSNAGYLSLVTNTPGMELSQGWTLSALNFVAAQPVLNLLNVKYVLFPVGLAIDFGKNIDFRVTDRRDLQTVENKQVWPRAFFTDKLVTAGSTAEFVQQLYQHARLPMAAISPEELEQSPTLAALAVAKSETVVPATNYRLLPNDTAFDVHAPSAGVICLTEGMAKDFTVTVNDRPEKVLGLNRAFKGVYVGQPGDYHIQFTYRPRYWTAACAGFWLGIAGTLLLAVAGIIQTRAAHKVSVNLSTT